MSELAELIKKIEGIDPEARKALVDNVLSDPEFGARWSPNAGPQYEAFNTPADLLLYGGQAGGGKALEIGTLIPTPEGFRAIGDLKPGDTVFSENGLPVKIVAVSEPEENDAFEVVFDTGERIIADGRHLWKTMTDAERLAALCLTDEWRANRRAKRPSRSKGKRSQKPWLKDVLTRLNKERDYDYSLPTLGRIRTTQEIADSVRVKNGRRNHSVAVCKPLQFIGAGAIIMPGATLPVDPYVLGLWLGDGRSRCGEIGMADEDWREIEIEEPILSSRLDPRNKGKPYRIVTVECLTTRIGSMGLKNDKRIPAVYLRASEEQRLALLQGLMDTDGHCDKRGQCELLLSKHDLLEDALELVSSLGIKATIRRKAVKGYGDAHRIKFVSAKPVFRLARKLERQKTEDLRQTTKRRYITEVNPVGKRLVRCIQVDDPSGMYLVGPTMVPTHNSGLIIGLALTRHKRSLLMRRQYNDLGALVDDCLEKYGTRQGFSGQPPARLKTTDERLIEFGAAKMPGDEEHWKGQPHDLIAIDEASQFLESQIRFLMGWLRSTDPDQRCRVVLATNPPEKPAEGQYLVKMFGPWLDPQHPLHPTPNGTLRWVITDEDGNDKWVDGPEEVMVMGRPMKPTSRTFIPAALADNPFLARTEYGARLDALPEPLRSAIRDGNWMIAHEDDPFQVIPTNWVIAAQERWTRDPPNAPMCSMGVDIALGGSNCTVLQPRYDTWFAEPISVPGSETPTGRDVAALVIKHRRNRAVVTLDMGGGYGDSTFDCLMENLSVQEVVGFKGAGASTARTQDRMFPFANKRAEVYWRFREALDPNQEGGSPIMLPPDSELAADLVSVRRLAIEEARNKIQLELKEKQSQRLGRSPDKGDAVVMSWDTGSKYLTHGQIWKDVVKSARTPRVIHGHMNRKRRWG